MKFNKSSFRLTVSAHQYRAHEWGSLSTPRRGRDDEIELVEVLSRMSDLIQPKDECRWR